MEITTQDAQMTWKNGQSLIPNNTTKDMQRPTNLFMKPKSEVGKLVELHGKDRISRKASENEQWNAKVKQAGSYKS